MVMQATRESLTLMEKGCTTYANLDGATPVCCWFEFDIEREDQLDNIKFH